MAFTIFNLATLSAFIPHGHCYLWKPELVGLHLVSDALIAFAYYSIPLTLFYFVRKRPDLPFRWAFMLFVIFIIACGTSHLMAIWTLWHPTYWVAGALKAITAIASVSTAILLLPIIPKALALPSPTQLEAANRELQAEITKRQRLEKERDGFFKLSPDLLCITTFDGYFQYVNPAWETETGFTTEELLANPYSHVIHPDDRAALAGDAQKVMAGIDSANYESRIQCKTGSVKWIAWSASAAPEEQLVYVVGRNITERKQTEVALRESEARFQAFMDNSPIAAWMTDETGRILYLNQTYFRLFKTPSDYVAGMSDLSIHPPEIAQQYLQNIRQVIETKQVVEAIESGVRPDGVVNEFLVYKFPILTESGECLVGGVAANITERKQIEVALQQSEAELHALFTAMQDVVLVRNAQGRCLKIAPTHTTDLVKHPDEMVGKTLHEVMPQSQADIILCTIQQALELQQTVSCEYNLMSHDRQVWFAASISPLSADSVVLVARNITERKQMEELLRYKTAKLEAIFRAIPDAIVFTDAQRCIQSVNPALTRLFDYQPEEVFGQKTEILYANPEVYRDLGETRYYPTASEQLKPYEVEYRRKNNATFMSETVGSVVKDIDGRTIGFIAVIRDITERKQTEERLKLQSTVLKNMAGGVCLVRTGDGGIAYTNPKFERMFGYDPGELNGKHVGILNYQSDQADANEVAQTIMATIQEQSEFTYEVHNVKKDGTPFWSQGTASVLEHPEYGTVMVAVQYDISDRKRAEQALRQSEERLQLALEGSGDGLWDWNITNNEVYLSPHYVEMLGYEVGELPGDISTWENLTHPEDQPWIREILTAHLKDSSHPYSFDYRVRTKSGEWKWIGNYGKVVIRDEDGNPLRMTGTHKDISDRKRAEAERQTLMLKLQQSNQELEQFAFIASHDLKEPLRTIRSFCSLLQSKHRDSLNEKAQDYLNRIQNATHRMQALINDLLSLSQVSTQAKPFLPVDLAKVVQEVTSGLQKQLQQTGGRVEVENLPTVHGDSSQLSQLFQNLISNALKFHRDVAPVVKISSQLQPATGNANDSGFQQILVEDNGIGFDEKHRDRIFEAFERLQGRGEYEGTGIGLAICKKIVERHGGNITVRSILGHGSTFIITLPIR